jgi:hypothetical protein
MTGLAVNMGRFAARLGVTEMAATPAEARRGSEAA